MLLQWSKTKSKLESFLCEKLKERVSIHATIYRKTHDSTGKVWITFDKKEILSSSHIKYTMEHFKLSRKVLAEKRELSIYEASLEAEAILMNKGLFEEYHLLRPFMDYSSLSIEEAISSNNIIIKAYSMFDKRLGKRRLKILNLTHDDHPLIIKFYKIRCEVEGIEL